MLYRSIRNNITDSIHLHVSAQDSQLSYTHKVTPGPVDQHHYGLCIYWETSITEFHKCDYLGIELCRKSALPKALVLRAAVLTEVFDQELSKVLNSFN